MDLGTSVMPSPSLISLAKTRFPNKAARTGSEGWDGTDLVPLTTPPQEECAGPRGKALGRGCHGSGWGSLRTPAQPVSWATCCPSGSPPPPGRAAAPSWFSVASQVSLCHGPCVPFLLSHLHSSCFHRSPSGRSPSSSSAAVCRLTARPRAISQVDPEGRKPHQLYPSCHISAADTSRMELWDRAWPPPPAPPLGRECDRRVPPGYRGLRSPCRRNSRDPDPTKRGRHIAS